MHQHTSSLFLAYLSSFPVFPPAVCVLGAWGGGGWRGSWRQGGKGGPHAPAHQQSFPCFSLFIPCIPPRSLRAWRVGRRGLEGELEAGREGRTACTSSRLFSFLVPAV